MHVSRRRISFGAQAAVPRPEKRGRVSGCLVQGRAGRYALEVPLRVEKSRGIGRRNNTRRKASRTLQSVQSVRRGTRVSDTRRKNALATSPISPPLRTGSALLVRRIRHPRDPPSAFRHLCVDRHAHGIVHSYASPLQGRFLGSVKGGLFDGLVTFFAMQPPDSLDKLSTAATAVAIVGTIAGFFHLGLLASFLATRFGRR